MARNGSGTYSLPTPPVVNGTTIDPNDENTLRSDIATALTQSIASDGQTVPTANLPMGTFKFTGMGTGSSLTDSATFGQSINAPAATTLASAATVNIGAALTTNIIISGAVTITAFDTVADGITRNITFSGAALLTHNATSLILPGGANITTAAGDCATFLSLGSGNWRCIKYVTASGFIRFVKGADIASAATVDLRAATGNTVHITGTTTIGAWTMTAGEVMNVIFDGILTLTYNATTNKLLSNASIMTAAADRAQLFYDGTTVYLFAYARADGTPLVGFGVGQILTDFTGTKLPNTTYTNSSANSITVYGTFTSTSSSAFTGVISSSTVVRSDQPSPGNPVGITLTVPPGKTYSFGVSGTAPTTYLWYEVK